MPIMGKQSDDSPLCLQYHDAFFDLTVTNEKCIIQFSSILLFNLLVNKMKSDFQLPEDVHVYNFQTRKDKLKCAIMINTVSRRIEVSEAGYNVWRQEFIDKTVPFLLSQLVRQTNADLGSTPDLEQEEEDDIVDDTLDNAAVLAAIQKLSQQVDSLRKERRVNKPSYAAVATAEPTELCLPKQFDRSSKDSVSKKQINRKNQGSSKAGNNPMKQTHWTQSPYTKASSTNVQPTFATVTSKGPTTPDGNSVAQKIATPNNQREPERSSPKKIETVVKNVLLTGSSIISRVNEKGLKSNVHKHAIPGATIATLTSELLLYDMKNFETVILYVGGNDVANGTDLELIEERYDKLLAQLKSSNPKIEVLVSKVAPRGDADVSQLNAIVERLASYHNAEVIDMFSAFHDQNGLLCTRYISNDSIHPSPSGIKRILGTVNQKVSVVKNFDMVVRVYNQDRRGFQTRRANKEPRMIANSLKCFKCGELNHETRQCRHRSPVTCWGCGFSGHKQQHCWSFA